MRLLLCLLLIVTAHARTHVSFNEGWKFFNAEAEGAEAPSFDDSSWRSLDLPHDWAIEGPFDVKYNARSGGLPFHGTGWYRKTFNVSAEDEGKRLAITFDGAMYDAHVWINGQFLGHRPFGYMGFQYDLSHFLNYGGENTIAVRLRPEDLSSRWYPGAGLYRNVWLTTTSSVYIPLWGVAVTTPVVSEKSADVIVKTELKNDTVAPQRILLRTLLMTPSRTDVVKMESWVSIPAFSSVTHTESLVVEKPLLWDLDNPQQYMALSEIIVDDPSILVRPNTIDALTTRFGIRSIEYDATKGFLLNGKHVQINGVCMHHDLGPLGAAVNTRATERQIEIMKSMGVNSYRTAHNPPSPELLDLCDKHGILVQVEAFDCWEMPKIPNGYNKFFKEWHEIDLRDMIRRDRNHPSVIMWSIGNEILEQGKKDGWKLARHLHRICKDEDPTRLTSAGFNFYPASIKNGLAAEVDIPGFNYKPLAYAEVREEYPDWHILASETSSCTSSRGVYHLPIEKYQKYTDNQVTSYDLIGPVWAYPPDIEFDSLAKTPSVIGEYVWTGFDYLGEPTPYGGRDNSTNGYWNDDWPSRSAYFGTVDLCGLPKDRFYLYQSQWTSPESAPMVHLLPHWNWENHEVKTIPVYAYTNGDEAELFLNGKSLGRKKKGTDKADVIVNFNSWPGQKEKKPAPYASPYRLRWDVPFEKGELKIVAYHNGKKIAEKAHHTAGPPAKISLSPDRTIIAPDGKDLSFITVSITDDKGHLAPRADNLVNFQVEGGVIAAVGNGNAASVESFQAPHRKAFSGKCMLIVKSYPGTAGDIKITATSEGLAPASTTIQAR
ncbi:MAG: beta-galactosidase GalB [Verrucomicrobiaceae bacterium]